MSQDGAMGSASLNNLTASLPVSVSNLNDVLRFGVRVRFDEGDLCMLLIIGS